MIYNLTILDFNEHDVNVLCTCYYGFEQYSKNLTLDSVNFESTYLFELFWFCLFLLFYISSTSFTLHREILSISYRKSKDHKKQWVNNSFRVIDFSSFYDFHLYFRPVPTMWYFYPLSVLIISYGGFLGQFQTG
jgi:hypothetical protein